MAFSRGVALSLDGGMPRTPISTRQLWHWTRYALTQLFIAGFRSVSVPAPMEQRGNQRRVYPNRPEI
jgi:hypothetical protein